jgi:hypothetical protein
MVRVCIYTIAFELSYFVPRFNLDFLSPKFSRGIDVVLVCLCPLDSITLGIILGESYYNWHPYACELFYFV